MKIFGLAICGLAVGVFYDKIGSHPQYSWSDLKRDIQAIDDYEGGR